MPFGQWASGSGVRFAVSRAQEVCELQIAYRRTLPNCGEATNDEGAKYEFGNG